MKRNRKSSKRSEETIQVWTYDQAGRVLPYVASIMRTLRESRLEALQQDRIVRKLALTPGRPGRVQLIAQEEAARLVRAAQDRFEEALEELHTLDIYCLDPVAGQALIPFAQDDELAWYVYDLFDGSSLRFWRYHRDPLETRRPVAAAHAGPAAGGTVIV
jgi:hypothetical protein